MRNIIMKICNKTGCGVCVNCDGTPPFTNGVSHGDICRKKVEHIIEYLSDGGLYRFDGENLYEVTFVKYQSYQEAKRPI